MKRPFDKRIFGVTSVNGGSVIVYNGVQIERTTVGDNITNIRTSSVILEGVYVVPPSV